MNIKLQFTYNSEYSDSIKNFNKVISMCVNMCVSLMCLLLLLLLLLSHFSRVRLCVTP